MEQQQSEMKDNVYQSMMGALYQCHEQLYGTLKPNHYSLSSLQSQLAVRQDQQVPVYVMLPLDTVNERGEFNYRNSQWFYHSLAMLVASGVKGVAMDVWWGSVEKQPHHYNWNGYKEIVQLLKHINLKLQVVLSFHACGGNVGDSVTIPLPSWVLKAGEADPDIYFQNGQHGDMCHISQRNLEYISFFVDEQQGIIAGRSPMQCYKDFMASFKQAFDPLLGPVIEEITIGSGPCGELRYPSYLESSGWRFPGIGSFQCSGKWASASLAEEAAKVGRPDWSVPPHDTGNSNSTPEDTGFFSSNGGWNTPYGHFFLTWYSKNLLAHGERLMKAANEVFGSKMMKKEQNTWGVCGSTSTSVASTRSQTGLFNNMIQSPAYYADIQNSKADEQSPVKHQPSNSELQHPRAGQQLPNGPFGDHKEDSTAPNAYYASTQWQHDNVHVGQSNGSTNAGVGSNCAPNQRQRNSRQGPAGGTSLHVIHDTQHYNHTSHNTVQETSSNSMQQTCLSLQGKGCQKLQVNDYSNVSVICEATCSGSTASMDTASTSAGDEPNDARHNPRVAQHQACTQGGAYSLGSTSVQGMPQSSLAAQWAGVSDHSVEVSIKIAGIHWWYRTLSHAAELTAGYYNTDNNNGYIQIVELCCKYNISLVLTCVEMCDAQHPPEAFCGPEGLLRQIRTASDKHMVALAGENALPCFARDYTDFVALERIVHNTRAWRPSATHLSASNLSQVYSATCQIQTGSSLWPNTSINDSNNEQSGQERQQLSGMTQRSYQVPPGGLPALRAFTFLRLTEQCLNPEHQAAFLRFMHGMHGAGGALGRSVSR